MNPDDVIANAEREDRRAAATLRRVARQAERRITDPATHPRPWVGLPVAMAFLEMDRRALNYFLDSGQLAWEWKGRRRKVRVVDLVAFKAGRVQRSA